MKLIRAHATNYRNIIDSNPVEIGQSTCLVGKNEAGKSAFLKALEGLRSTDKTFTEYGKITNYPRRAFADYAEDYGTGEARVMLTSWDLEDSDVRALAAILGPKALQSRTVTVEKTYEQSGTSWSVPLDHAAVVTHLIDTYGLSTEERAPLAGASTTVRVAVLLNALEVRSATQQALLDAIVKFRDNDASLKAIDLLSALMPRFMYFSHYDRMSGELSINKLAQDRSNGTEIASGDRVFLDFLEYAGTTLEDLTATNQFEELNAKCEAAALRITDQIFEYWTQNDELKIKVVLSEGKSGDPAPFNSGPVARARVEWLARRDSAILRAFRGLHLVFLLPHQVRADPEEARQRYPAPRRARPDAAWHGAARPAALLRRADRAQAPANLVNALAIHGAAGRPSLGPDR